MGVAIGRCQSKPLERKAAEDVARSAALAEGTARSSRVAKMRETGAIGTAWSGPQSFWWDGALTEARIPLHPRTLSHHCHGTFILL